MIAQEMADIWIWLMPGSNKGRQGKSCPAA
jgi:hypothetical protein